jgi:phage gpG-like protein
MPRALEIDFGLEFGSSRRSMRLAEITAKVATPHSALRAAVDEIEHIVKMQFLTEGALGASGSWDEVTEEWFLRKIRQGGSPSILISHGELIDSLLGGPGAVREYHLTGDAYVDFGTEVDYFKYHQSKAPRTVMPRRPIFDFTPTHRRDIGDAVRREFLS